MFDGLLCFKSEYHTESGKMEVFNEGGEYLSIKNNDMVQPVKPEWTDIEF